MRIGILGDAICDIDLHSTPRENAEGAGRCYTAPIAMRYPGGAANVAWLLRQMGVNVELFAAVGEGSEGDFLQRSREYPYWHGGVLALQRITNVCQRTYHNGNLVFRQDIDASQEEGQWYGQYVYENCLSGIPPCDAEKFDAFVFADYAKGILGPKSGCDEVVRRIIESGIPTIVDPHVKGRTDLWQGATIATPNILEHEALGDLGTQWTAVTRGNIGVGLYEGEEARDFYRVPDEMRPKQPQIVGAGDAFTAAIAREVADGTDVPTATRQAMLFASRYVGCERGAAISGA